jgi:Tfp pilus assembly protein PilX
MNLRFQHGSSLIVSMIILVILMLLGVSSMMVSDTSFKLAGNLQFQDSALNNAETALSTAEEWIGGSTGGVSNIQDPAFGATTSGGLYTLAANPDPLNMTWNDSTSLTVDGNVSQRYLIDLMSEGNQLLTSGVDEGGRPSAACNKVNTYRIVGRGSSARGAVKFVESYYSVLSC